jgi:hypothetical protein
MICIQLCTLDTIHHAAFNKLETQLPNALWSTQLIALDCTLSACLTYAHNKAFKMLSIALLSILSSTFPIALDGTLAACLTIPYKVNSQDALNHIPEQPLKYTPNCARLHTRSLIDYTLPSTLSRPSQLHSRACSQVQSQLHSMASTQPA